MRENPTETLQQHENTCDMCIKGIHYCPEGTRLNKEISENQTIRANGKGRETAENPAKDS